MNIWKTLAELKKKQAKEIEQWAQDSERTILESRDSGTTKKVSLEMVRAVKLTAKRPETLAKSLEEDVVQKLLAFKNESYGKSFLQLKKVEEFEKEFKKHQKPWIKHLKKVTDAQQICEETQKKLKGAVRLDKISQSDVGKTDEEREESKANVEKRTKDADAAKKKYQSARDDMNTAKPHYAETMTKTLEQTHEFERKRMNQFYRSFLAVQTIFVKNEETENEELNTAFTKALGIHNINEDIQKWNQGYGSEADHDWPCLDEIKEWLIRILSMLRNSLSKVEQMKKEVIHRGLGPERSDQMFFSINWTGNRHGTNSKDDKKNGEQIRIVFRRFPRSARDLAFGLFLFMYVDIQHYPVSLAQICFLLITFAYHRVLECLTQKNTLIQFDASLVNILQLSEKEKGQLGDVRSEDVRDAFAPEWLETRDGI